MNREITRLLVLGVGLIVNDVLVVDGWLSVGVVAQKVLVSFVTRHNIDISLRSFYVGCHPPVFLFFFCFFLLC